MTRLVGPLLALLLLLMLTLTLLPLPALTEKRVALVIGNGVYRSENRLANPPSDALLISQALTKAGFKTIETKINLATHEGGVTPPWDPGASSSVCRAWPRDRDV